LIETILTGTLQFQRSICQFAKTTYYFDRCLQFLQPICLFTKSKQRLSNLDLIIQIYHNNFVTFIPNFYEQGLTGITICATMSIFVPNQENCDQLSLLLGNCEPAKPWQMTYLYTVLYITAFGAAGIVRYSWWLEFIIDLSFI
jgi:hypothetical protein